MKRSSRNTSSRGRTRYPRSKRSGESPRRSDRCYSSARSARSRLSPQYGQDTVAIHFTWKREQERVERALLDVERALDPFEPRPHWGKLFLAGAATLAPRYERLDDFAALLGRVDPRGAVRNAWIESRVLAGAA